ncbi:MULTISPECIES: penicillin-binding transpeptidase domain-containing protein [unclassified Streptomyces]|uniref:penicillin-binding transpeptidase domain-containing protein n=1 Tax=unclassified Streptomyces TaxID=2593676 RepID=UPI002349BA97|nr:penicillin-binding transpeptidase domain-containing protein [Streptomyces sp. M92]WCN03342.1 penicillin-binding transpeptidase domain-containing protein [Streptomyces sp. M92]
MTHEIQSPQRRRSARRRPVIGILVAVAVVAGAGYWVYNARGGQDDAEVTAATGRVEDFLAAWEAGNADKAASYTDTPDAANSLIDSVLTNLKPTKVDIAVDGDAERVEGEVKVPFRVGMQIPGVGEYTWNSNAVALKENKGDAEWTVEFTTPMIHPEMKPGQTLALQSRERAKILDSTGAELQASSLAGTVDPKSGKGVSGLQARYDKQLAGGGGAAKSVVVADRQSGRAVKQLSGEKRDPGEPVKTTIVPRVQNAAAEALEGVDKNAAIVAIAPSSGRILAAANVPGGMNRALAGRYAPGSTFKVVTTAALLKTGMRPEDVAGCPEFAHVNGQRFENQDRFTLPAGSTFKDSFAESCNTFFVNARSELSNSALRDTAKAFGIGGVWDVGDATFDGSVPVSKNENERAASMIGQARVEASPLVMASVAATVKEGEFKQPVLVPGAVRKKHETSAALDPAVVADLRMMMRATVTEGAGGKLRDVPGQPHAKTGTAEFGNEDPPRTHAWMIGFQGDRDLAWAVLLEDGGSGGSDAGPVAAKFLRNLG